MKKFESIKQFLSICYPARDFLNKVFETRDSGGVSYDVAVEHFFADKEEKVKQLIGFGVVERISHNLELNDMYLSFFEEALNPNESINSLIVRTYIEDIILNIKLYNEASQPRKPEFLRKIVRLLKRIGSTTSQNVSTLKRNIDDTYKQEPDFGVKKLRLLDFGQKRKQISDLIDETLKEINGDTFFISATDHTLVAVIKELKEVLNHSSHSLLAIQDDIITYINKIEYQSNFVKNVRKLKYLKDRHLLQDSTDIMEHLQQDNALWHQKELRFRTNTSLSFLREDDASIPIIDAVQKQLKKSLKTAEKDSVTIDKDYLENKAEVMTGIDRDELFVNFQMQHLDLLEYIMELKQENLTEEDRMVLYVQMVAQFGEAMIASNDYSVIGTKEFLKINPDN